MSLWNLKGLTSVRLDRFCLVLSSATSCMNRIDNFNDLLDCNYRNPSSETSTACTFLLLCCCEKGQWCFGDDSLAAWWNRFSLPCFHHKHPHAVKVNLLPSLRTSSLPALKLLIRESQNTKYFFIICIIFFSRIVAAICTYYIIYLFSQRQISNETNNRVTDCVIS